MQSLAIPEQRVLVLASGETTSEINDARGKLLERFVARLLYQYGYGEPRVENLNVLQDGIEIDVTAKHSLTKHGAMAECKAYSTNVNVEAVKNFYGALSAARLEDADTFGLLVVLPRLTRNGDELARKIAASDRKFLYLNADGISAALHERNELTTCPIVISLTSDPAIVITNEGVYSAAHALNADTRTASQVVTWGSTASVPKSVLELLRASDYAAGLPVADARSLASGHGQAMETTRTQSTEPEPVVVSVAGSTSDFEYQLPASPTFFVGRRNLVADAEAVLAAAPRVLVLNAQSGWGKSSLALRLVKSASQRNGAALIVDSRTAQGRRFVTAALRRLAGVAVQAGSSRCPTMRRGRHCQAHCGHLHHRPGISSGRWCFSSTNSKTSFAMRV